MCWFFEPYTTLARIPEPCLRDAPFLGCSPACLDTVGARKRLRTQYVKYRCTSPLASQPSSAMRLRGFKYPCVRDQAVPVGCHYCECSSAHTQEVERNRTLSLKLRTCDGEAILVAPRTLCWPSNNCACRRFGHVRSPHPFLACLMVLVVQHA